MKISMSSLKQLLDIIVHRRVVVVLVVDKFAGKDQIWRKL